MDFLIYENDQNIPRPNPPAAYPLNSDLINEANNRIADCQEHLDESAIMEQANTESDIN